MAVVQSPPATRGTPDGPDPTDAEALFKEAKQRERRRRLFVVGALLAACLVVTVAVVATAGGFSTAGNATRSSASKPIEVASNARTHAYQLPTDGWKPGDGRLLAAFFGRFHATLTPSGACAWMYTPNRGIVYLWPAGYRVRFDPTELLSPSGKVVAREGQEVNAAGGGYPEQAVASLSPTPAIPDYCGTVMGVILIESPVAVGHGPQ
jgi:hypothetical protein